MKSGRVRKRTVLALESGSPATVWRFPGGLVYGDVRLSMAMAACLFCSACSSGNGWWFTPLWSEPDDSADALRAKLTARMSEHRVLPYREAWTVVANGASVSPSDIELFYTLRVVPAAHRASGKMQRAPDYWNREHIWPRSYGLKGTPALTDVHNLVPADWEVNRARSNKYFDELEGAHELCTACAESSAAWEPPTKHKGDVARIAFYMDVRYEGQPESRTPDLSLGETLDSGTFRFGKLSTLLRWHCEDPVSPAEQRRHEVAANAQGNRNVFVDDSSLVSAVYGSTCAGLP